MSIAKPIASSIVSPILETISGGRFIISPTIENGGFEVAGSTTVFDSWDQVLGGSSTLTRDTSEKYSGNASFKMGIVSGVSSYIYKPQARGLITTGKNYSYSFWGKADSSGKVIGIQNVTIYPHTLTTSWERYTGSFVGQPGSIILIRRTFSLTYNIWVDNFELIEEQ